MCTHMCRKQMHIGNFLFFTNKSSGNCPYSLVWIRVSAGADSHFAHYKLSKLSSHQLRIWNFFSPIQHQFWCICIDTFCFSTQQLFSEMLWTKACSATSPCLKVQAALFTNIWVQLLCRVWDVTFRTEAKRFIIRDSSLSSSSSKSNIGILKLSIILQHLEFSSLGSKGSTMIGSVPLISQRQKGQPWPSDSYSKTKM